MTQMLQRCSFHAGMASLTGTVYPVFLGKTKFNIRREMQQQDFDF